LGNIVEALFDFVERTKFQRKTRSTLLPFLATKSNVASTLLTKNGNNVDATFNIVAATFDSVASTMLLVWTGLYYRATYDLGAASRHADTPRP